MRTIFVRAALGLLSGASLAGPAAGSTNWLISDAANTLYDYAQGGGAATNPRHMSVDPNSLVLGIDFSASGTLYALTTYSDNSLYTINPATGAASRVGVTGLTQLIEGDIGFDPTNGVLYGMYSGNGPTLFTLDVNTGAATAVGHFAGDDPSGLAFDNAGNLWVVLSNANTTRIATLLQVDKQNGQILSAKSMGISLGVTLGADFDPTTNVLYVAGKDGSFYSVDTATGATALVEPEGALATGLAYVPEPAALSLLAVALARLRRR